jgi:hypothetical protein
LRRNDLKWGLPKPPFYFKNDSIASTKTSQEYFRFSTSTFFENSSASASLKNLTIASAIFSGEGSTIKPVFPSRTTSGRPPTFVAITGC